MISTFDIFKILRNSNLNIKTCIKNREYNVNIAITYKIVRQHYHLTATVYDVSHQFTGIIIALNGVYLNWQCLVILLCN